MALLIRPPHPDRDEREAVLRVHRAAFGREDEARLVQQLHLSGRDVFELLAECDGTIVAHVAFSPVTIEHGEDGRARGLAPVAVLPAWQRQGIGTRLIGEALQALRAAALRGVVVLGDPTYYARFGFEPASRYGLHDIYGGGDAFMTLALYEGSMRGYRGRVDYAPEFANVTD
jgi:putative acetyltransferase